MLDFTNPMQTSPYYEPSEFERWLLGEEVDPETEKEFKKILDRLDGEGQNHTTSKS